MDSLLTAVSACLFWEALEEGPGLGPYRQAFHVDKLLISDMDDVLVIVSGPCSCHTPLNAVLDNVFFEGGGVEIRASEATFPEGCDPPG